MLKKPLPNPGPKENKFFKMLTDIFRGGDSNQAATWGKGNFKSHDCRIERNMGLALFVGVKKIVQRSRKKLIIVWAKHAWSVFPLESFALRFFSYRKKRTAVENK